MNLFGYFSLGLRSMSAAQLGLQVAGDNIANAFTPGYARRRLELSTGYPVSVAGGQLGQGVDVVGLRRLEDQFLEASLQREQGRQAGSEERLRGLRQVESFFGSIDSAGSLSSSLSAFSSAFDELAGQPDNLAYRRDALSAAEGLARTIRNAYGRLSEQRGTEDRTAASLVQRVNGLADELASLNREIAGQESGGGVAAPLRDKRAVVVEELVRLTGGSAVPGKDGRLSFSVPGGPTLVTGDDSIPLETSRAADGTLRVLSGGAGRDITDRLRQGRLGAVLYIRDETITGAQADLDTLAADLITRANTLTTGALDRQGDPGGPLFEPDPPGVPGAAGQIAVDAALLQAPELLAVSSNSSPGEGDVARALAGLAEQDSVALGDSSASAFVADLLSALGEEVVQTDVDQGVSLALVDSLTAQREAVSGVSLDEEAVNLIQSQRSFEAAAQFLQVLNSITEVAIGLVGR